MKKAFVILLMMLYGFSSTGMTVQLHYCCGKLKNIELIATHEGCGSEHKMDSKLCCETKEISYKEIHDQLTSQLATNIFKSPSEPVKQINFFVGQSLSKSNISPTDSSPPIASPPIYLLHHVFRI